MSENSFHFKIGDFDCLVVRDGTFIVPKLEGDLKLESNCLLIKTKGHKILVDTGYGPVLAPNAGKLIQNLEAEGIGYSDIDTIILSHCHPDHIGGNIDAEGRSAFPNARYIIHKKEWEYWTLYYDPTSLDSEWQKFLKPVPKILEPIKDQINLVGSGEEIIRGINLLSAPGHTPGHIVLIISSGNEQLLHTCDLFHEMKEIEMPHLELQSDYLTEQASHTRVQILNKLAAENILTFVCHFYFPCLGHVVQKGDRWFWRPIRTMHTI